MAKIHRLKTWPDYFDAVDCGRKPFEIRKDDRGYEVDDVLVLDRFAEPGGYTVGCRPIVRVVTYLFRGPMFGVEEGYVVMGLDKVAEKEAEKAILWVAPPRTETAVPKEGGNG